MLGEPEDDGLLDACPSPTAGGQDGFKLLTTLRHPVIDALMGGSGIGVTVTGTQPLSTLVTPAGSCDRKKAVTVALDSVTMARQPEASAWQHMPALPLPCAAEGAAVAEGGDEDAEAAALDTGAPGKKRKRRDEATSTPASVLAEK